ncbi:HigA family addiction module antitoxin [Pseudonocardia saturnea]
MTDQERAPVPMMRASQSMQPDELKPDWSVHPGDLLARILDQKKVRQSELAERTGLSAKHINQIVGRSIGVTADTAVVLARALDTRAAFWLEAQADWDLCVSEQRAAANSILFETWARGFDRSALLHHKVIDQQDDTGTVAEKLMRFFGVSSPAAFDETWMKPRVSFRRAQKFTVKERNTALWLRLVDRGAKGQHTTDLRPRALRQAVSELRGLTRLPLVEGFLAARQVLSETGVVLLFVPEIEGTRLCGATWWLDARRPVIAVTQRYRKTDSFWFNVFHEIGHVILHPKRETFLNIAHDKSANDGAEEEANDYARDLLIGSSLGTILAANSRDDFIRVARHLGVSVSIIAAQYARAKKDYAGIAAKLRSSIEESDIARLEEISQVA